MSTPIAVPGARVSPDRTFVGILAIVIVMMVMLASMIFSFTAIVEAAVWTHNPEWVLWLAAVVVDGPILVYTLSYAIFRWRGKKHYRHSMRVLITFTGLSVVINALHAAVGWEWDFTRTEMWVGMLIAAAAPIGALLAAHEVTRLVFIQHEDVQDSDVDESFVHSTGDESVSDSDVDESFVHSTGDESVSDSEPVRLLGQRKVAPL